MKKAFSAPTIHFKGSGWAKKERRATSAPSASSGKDGSSGSSKGGDGGSRDGGSRDGGSASRVGRQRVRAVERVRRRRVVDDLHERGRLELQGLDRGVHDLGRRLLDRLTMAGAADWITLAEAQEILADASTCISRPRRSGLGPDRSAAEHQARRPSLRPARRGPGARHARRVACRRESVQAGLFEDLRD